MVNIDLPVPHSTTLEQLVEKVAKVTSIDLSEFVISMKFKFKTSSEPFPPMEILNDCDVEFFWKKLIAVSEILSASLLNVG